MLNAHAALAENARCFSLFNTRGFTGLLFSGLWRVRWRLSRARYKHCVLGDYSGRVPCYHSFVKIDEEVWMEEEKI